MRVLVRGEEIIVEPFDQWTLDHLDWLTTPRPDGDGYTLIEDYEPPAEAQEAQEEAPAPEAPQEPAETPSGDDVVIIDGVEYRRTGA